MFTAEIEGEAEIEALWARAVNEVRVGIVRGVGLGAKEGAAEAREKHRFQNRSGDLERSIQHIVIGWTSDTMYVAKIEAKMPYASYVEEGTKPHRIEGNPFLAFIWKGEQVFFRYVNHPGSKPYPFMGIGYLKAERVVQREIEMGIARAAELLAK